MRSNIEQGTVRQNPDIHPEQVHLGASQEVDDDLLETLLDRMKDNGQGNEVGNQELPIYECMPEIFEKLDRHQVVICKSSTGSGKSTQIPQQAILHGYDRVVETQNRRISAREIAGRIADELVGSLGENARNLTGFHTGEKRFVPDDARIVVMTTGVQLLQMKNRQNNYTNKLLIIDEVHQAEIDQEVTLVLVKELLKTTPDTRVLIQSANAECVGLTEFFKEVCELTPAVVELEARQYPIEVIEEPSSTTLLETIKYAKIVKDGILVFESGKGEINNLIDLLYEKLPPKILKDATILPLYSELSRKQQQDALAIPEKGIKIIVSTNVAQEAITVPGVSVVVDSGEERRNIVDNYGVVALVLRHVSKTALVQRGGRGGRLSSGIHVITRPNEKSEFVPISAREEYDPPKISNSNLERVALHMASIDKDIDDVDFYHEVSKIAKKRAKLLLQKLGAIDEQGLITTIGRRMDGFPVMPIFARMLVEADKYSPRVRSYMAAITSCIESGGISFSTPEPDGAWSEFLPEDVIASDLLVNLALFISAQDMKLEKMRESDINIQKLSRAYEKYEKIVRRSGASRTQLAKPTEQEIENIQKCIYAGLASSLYEHAGSGKFVATSGPDASRRQLSNRSVVRWDRKDPNKMPRLVVGTPRNIERYNHELKPIIENLTVVTNPEVLGSVAINLCEWVNGGLVWRDGQATLVQNLQIGRLQIGTSREVAAPPSKEIRNAIIQHAMEHPGPAQQELRAIKKELEQLNHLAKGPVPQLTQDRLEWFIELSTPKDVTDLTHIDNNLRVMMVNEGINLGHFISPEDRQRIIDNAPSSIDINGMSLQIRYSNGHASAYGYSPDEVIATGVNPFLPDGRPVRFRYDHATLNLKQLIEAESIKKNRLYKAA